MSTNFGGGDGEERGCLPPPHHLTAPPPHRPAVPPRQASKFLRTFDDPLYGAPLAIAGVLAGGFAAGHSSRAAFSAARAAFRGGAKPPSGAKPKSSVRPPK
mmetsp:Transcript_49494/g.140220  ORF Transcript_49494/g.140220 Transcript_49494/m.140220 type:complete len:101 (+) Transcript_49494:310-612(+)